MGETRGLGDFTVGQALAIRNVADQKFNGRRGWYELVRPGRSCASICIIQYYHVSRASEYCCRLSPYGAYSKTAQVTKIESSSQSHGFVVSIVPLKRILTCDRR